MTTILINAISPKWGGSAVVLRELLAGMAALRPDWKWYAVVSSDLTIPMPDLPNVEYLRFPGVDRSGLRTRLWYETRLPALARHLGADLLFSMTNYLSLRRLPCRSLLLVQQAGHFSPVFQQLMKEQLGFLGRLAWRQKGRWVKASVRRADAVTVQTAALAGPLAVAAGVPRSHIKVVSHGAGLAVVQAQPAPPPAAGAAFRVGYVTKSGVQKNFALLFQALAELKKKGIPVVLALTMSEEYDENLPVLESAASHGVMDIVENHGELSAGGIDRLYRSLHTFVFPSLCESFGLPMVEAMTYGIPLLVADVPSNVEVAGAGGLPVPPDDPHVLAQELERLIADGEWFRNRAQASLDRGRQFDWKRAAAQTIALIEEQVGKNGK